MADSLLRASERGQITGPNGINRPGHDRLSVQEDVAAALHGRAGGAPPEIDVEFSTVCDDRVVDRRAGRSDQRPTQSNGDSVGGSGEIRRAKLYALAIERSIDRVVAREDTPAGERGAA